MLMVRPAPATSTSARDRNARRRRTTILTDDSKTHVDASPSQQMRGSASPNGRSRMRSPPTGVRSTTMPGCSAVTRPMRAASRPERMRAHAPRARARAPSARHERDQLALVGDAAADRGRGSRTRRARRRAPASRARRPRCRAAGARRSRPASPPRRRASGRASRGSSGQASQHRRDELVQRRGVARERRRRTPAPRAATGWRRRDRRSCPRRRIASPGRTVREPRARRPAGTTPMPEVLMKILSPLPRPTTLVSPVTMRHAGALGGARAPSRPRARSSASGSPSSRMNASDRQSGRAPPTARSLTVPLTASSPMSPPGKKIGVTTYESVVNASRAAVDRRAIA